MLRFAHPFALLLLIPLLTAAWFVYRRRPRQGVVFAATARLPPSRRSWRTIVLDAAPALYLLGTAAAIVALARPQTMLSTVRRHTESLGIVMTVDVSGSMRALDMSDVAAGRIVKERTRLDAVKEMFARFVAKRPDDMIGLVAFGGYASTRAPLTLDHDVLLHVLKAVEIPSETLDSNGNLVGGEEFMTAIGDAILTSCARLEHAPLASKVVVLLSDGESNTGMVEPLEALKIAKKLNVRIYTIGVGSNSEAPFRVTDRFGRQGIQWARVSYDEAMMRKIASETGGRHFNVRDTSGLESALESINELEKTKVEKDVYRQFEEHAGWLIGPGLALVGLSALLGMGFARRIV
jgi:Ca-activated chloride channel family protein